MRLLDGETSHELGILAMKLGLMPKDSRPDPEILKTTVWGKTFSTPVGETEGRVVTCLNLLMYVLGASSQLSSCA